VHSPLLFAILANVIAMVDNGALDQNKSDSPAQKVLQSVEALQSTNRRILDRLRPMYIEGTRTAIQYSKAASERPIASPGDRCGI
jgi:two-component system sensor histidine kinase UhpB